MNRGKYERIKRSFPPVPDDECYDDPWSDPDFVSKALVVLERVEFLHKTGEGGFDANQYDFYNPGKEIWSKQGCYDYAKTKQETPRAKQGPYTVHPAVRHYIDKFLYEEGFRQTGASSKGFESTISRWIELIGFCPIHKRHHHSNKVRIGQMKNLEKDAVIMCLSTNPKKPPLRLSAPLPIIW